MKAAHYAASLIAARAIQCRLRLARHAPDDLACSQNLVDVAHTLSGSQASLFNVAVEIARWQDGAIARHRDRLAVEDRRANDLACRIPDGLGFPPQRHACTVIDDRPHGLIGPLGAVDGEDRRIADIGGQHTLLVGVVCFGLLRSKETAAAPYGVGAENERGGHGRTVDDAACGKQRQAGKVPADARKERHGRRLGTIVPASLGTLDDECVGAECGRLLGFGDAADLHPDLDPGLFQPLDMLQRRQRPEEDGERHLFLNENGNVFIGDEVADQINAERPFCQCLRLPDEIAKRRRAD